MSGHLRNFLVYLLIGVLPLLLRSVPSLERLAPPGGGPRLLLIYAPAFSLIVVGFLGLKLNQTRVLFCSWLMAAAGAILSSPDSWPVLNLLAGQGPAIQSLALPAALFICLLVPEGRLLGLRGALRLLASTAPFAFLALTAAFSPGSLRSLIVWEPLSVGVTAYVPQASLILTAAFILILPALHDKAVRGFFSALAASLIPWLYATWIVIRPPAEITQADITIHLPLALAAIAIMFLHAMFAMYMRRIYLDELTGVLNRRALEERLRAISGPLTVGMIDVDHFKSFNDRFGHDEGDNVLRLVAGHLTRHLGDTVYRYGGEEFCILLEGNDRSRALALVERARRTLSARSFHIRSGQPRRKTDRATELDTLDERTAPTAEVKITFSAGLAQSSAPAGADPEALLKRADEALYQAKQEGRDRVVAT